MALPNRAQSPKSPQKLNEINGRPRQTAVAPFKLLGQDRGRNPGGFHLQAAREIAREPLGFLGIVLVPGLPERLLDAGMKALVEAALQVDEGPP